MTQPVYTVDFILLTWFFQLPNRATYRLKSEKLHDRQKLSNSKKLQIFTIAEISPSAWRYETILLLWAGSTRANRRAFLTALACSASERSSNSRPVNALPSTASVSEKTPIRRQIAAAVACNSYHIKKWNPFGVINYKYSAIIFSRDV